MWKKGKSNRIGTRANTEYMKKLGYTLAEIKLLNSADYMERNDRMKYILQKRREVDELWEMKR